MIYRAVKNAIYDSNERQIAVVVPSNCSMKTARELAAYAAQQLTHAERDKARRAATVVPALERKRV